MTDERLFSRHVLGSLSKVELILRVHLWVEHFMEALLTLRLERPADAGLDRLAWRQKVGLASAMGLIEHEGAAELLALNKLRNRLSHELTSEPTDAEVAKLIAASRASTRHAIEAARATIKDPSDWTPPADPKGPIATLRLWAMVVAMDLDHRRRCLAYQVDNETQIHEAIGVHWARNRWREKGLAVITIDEVEAELGLPPRPQPGAFFQRP